MTFTHRPSGSRPLALVVGALLLVFAAVAACERPSVEQIATTAVVPVAVETARVDTIESTVAATGLVTPAPGAELIVVAPDAGRIAELPRAEGETVRAGDLLVRFDIPTLAADLGARQAAVAQVAARLEAAKTNLARLSSLLTQGVAAPRDVEEATRAQAEAQADVEQARSAVTAAGALAARTVVRAAFAGVVAKRYHNPGDFVEASASDPVLRVINPAQLQVVANVPLSDLPRITVGHAAGIVGPGHEEAEAATVLTKASQVEPGSLTAGIRLAFKKPTQLASGSTVRVEIVSERRVGVLVIPVAALVTDEGELFVMVAGDDNKAHKYSVAAGLSTRTMTEITSGIKAGDRVIVRGQSELPEGAAVSVEAK
ncbi:MAG: efflux RND transporter periplasmic adaptor subunit [Vicinamibacterales bacterium]